MSENSLFKKPRYRLYIDESGDHTYNLLDDPSHRYLALLGVWFRQADDYVAFQDKFRKAGKKYLTDVQKAMTMDGELGMIIGNFVGALQEATEQFKEFIEDYRVEKAKKDVQKIYKSNHLSDT